MEVNNISDNWVIRNLENAIGTWNEKLAELWQLLTQTPESFRGGQIWGVIVNIHSALAGVGYGLLVLFFAMGLFQSAASFRELQRPEFALRHFIRFVAAKVAVGKLEKVHVFGNDYPTPDGTGIRDYIHVVDLAKGHVCAIRKLAENPGLVVYNLGTGHGYSVLDVIHAFEKACGKQLPYVIDPRRPGDIAECWADPTKARQELGWEARYGIEDMCAHSWNWQSRNPDGYGK